jgi:hypothetical protein
MGMADGSLMAPTSTHYGQPVMQVCLFDCLIASFCNRFVDEPIMYKRRDIVCLVLCC